MAWVETRITRTSQPQDAAQLDRSNAFGRDVLFAETPSNPRGGEKTQPVRGGMAYVSDGTSASNFSFPIPPTTLGDFTMFFVGKGLTNNAAACAFSLSGPASASYNDPAAFMFEAYNNTNKFGFDGVALGTDRAIFDNDQQEHVAVLVRSNTGMLLYLDGKYVGVVGLTSGSTITVDRVKLFHKALLNVDTPPAGSYIKTYGVIPRLSSASEVKSLSDNPWQIFEPEIVRIWVDDYVSAGGGATVIPIGVQATGSVGTPSVTGAANATPSGVSTAASVGTPTAAGGSSIAATALPSGVAASSAVGAPTATGAAVAQPAGVSAVSAVGVPVAIAGANIPATALPAGVQASGAVGTAVATGAAVAQPIGVASTAYVGTPTIATGVSGVAVAYPAGVQAIGQVGTLIATGAAWTAAVGVQAVASVGTPSAYAGIQVIYTPGAQTRPSRLQSSSRPSRLQTGTRPSR